MSHENTMKVPTDPLTTMKVPIRRGVGIHITQHIGTLRGDDGEEIGSVAVSMAGVLEVSLHGHTLRVHPWDVLHAVNDGIDGMLTNLSAEDMAEALDAIEGEEGTDGAF